MAFRRRSRKFNKKKSFKRKFNKKSFKRKPLYSAVRRIKKARTFNRGKLSLQRSLMTGGSLPYETTTRVFWRGSGVVNLTNAAGSDPGADQTFVLSSIRGPVATNVAPAVSGSTVPMGMRGTIAYADQWNNFYDECNITGSKIKIVIRNPMYPSTLSGIQESGNPGNGANMHVDSMYGFWYLRYYYCRYNVNADQVANTDYVGQPITAAENTLWRNMRDFMADPTVTWVRDKIPKATKLHFSRNYLSAGSTLFPMSTEQEPRVTYEMEYSTRPVKLIAAFSRKRHFQSTPKEGGWEPTANAETTMFPYTYQPVGTNPVLYVRYGYIAFNNQGNLTTHTPADLINNKQIEVTWMARLRLRTPKVNPWAQVSRNYPVDGTVAINRIPPEILQDPDLNSEDEIEIPVPDEEEEMLE